MPPRFACLAIARQAARRRSPAVGRPRVGAAREIVEAEGRAQHVRSADRRRDRVSPKACCCRPIRTCSKDLNDVAAKLRTESRAARGERAARKSHAPMRSRFTEQELKEIAGVLQDAARQEADHRRARRRGRRRPRRVDDWVNKFAEEVDGQDPRRDEEEGPQPYTDRIASADVASRARHAARSRSVRHRRRLRRRARRAHRVELRRAR